MKSKKSRKVVTSAKGTKPVAGAPGMAGSATVFEPRPVAGRPVRPTSVDGSVFHPRNG